MFVILEGALDLMFGVGGQLVPTFVQYAGEVTGLLPFSRMVKYSGVGRAASGGPLRMLRIHKDRFGEMLARIPVLGQRLVATMTDRVRDSTRSIQQREKLTALGTLAAGLAHELNNPAAAVRRHAEALETRLGGLADLAADLCAMGLDGPSLRALGTLAESLRQRPAPIFDALGRSRCEEAVGEWLDGRGVADAWVLAGALVDAGVTDADLESVARLVPAGAMPGAIRWIETLVDATRLAHDIRAASARISELVQSVKTYSHMDRAGNKDPIDLREGLDSTLVMLGHKLKKKNLRLEREYAENLPKVAAYPGELNQVWTNLIDNAIDAAPEGGLIRIEALLDSATSAAVRVIDNGPGVPVELQSRIFEPFFTTKPVGQGTGLGLDIVERIVVQQHGGKVELESQPGRTVFIVKLPAVWVARATAARQAKARRRLARRSVAERPRARSAPPARRSARALPGPYLLQRLQHVVAEDGIEARLVDDGEVVAEGLGVEDAEGQLREDRDLRLDEDALAAEVAVAAQRAVVLVDVGEAAGQHDALVHGAFGRHREAVALRAFECAGSSRSGSSRWASTPWWTPSRPDARWRPG